jgi:hypothetical protein
MTGAEATWLASTDPQLMLGLLRNLASDRKLRLFGVACCLHGKPPGVALPILEMVEGYADDLLGWEELWKAFLLMPKGTAIRKLAIPRAFDVDKARSLSVGLVTAADHSSEEAEALYDGISQAREPTTAEAEEIAAHCRFLRDLFGNPFRPVALAPRWNTPEVCSLARVAYDQRSPERCLDTFRLAILADALEEAGCTNAVVLDHLRDPGPHVRGCWVLDLLLGKT